MGGPILISRIAAALVRGHMKRHKWYTGMGFRDKPHIYCGRAGLLDIDMMQHMNNASYLTHAELARWELFTQSGLLHWAMSKKTSFIVASTSISYLREIKPFQPFEVHTRVVATDDKSIFISQEFHTEGSSHLLAQYITRAIIRGAEIVHPHELLVAIGANDKLIESISSPEEYNDEVHALQNLEIAQRKITS